MHETSSQFILLKIPLHSVRLLGKIHALSIEVLCISTLVLLGHQPTFPVSGEPHLSLGTVTPSKSHVCALRRL